MQPEQPTAFRPAAQVGRANNSGIARTKYDPTRPQISYQRGAVLQLKLPVVAAGNARGMPESSAAYSRRPTHLENNPSLLRLPYPYSEEIANSRLFAEGCLQCRRFCAPYFGSALTATRMGLHTDGFQAHPASTDRSAREKRLHQIPN